VGVSSLARSSPQESALTRREGHRPHVGRHIETPIVITLRFRRFDVVPSKRRLLCDGLPIDIGGRAFDLLLILLQSRGELVTKEKIVSYVWPSTVVDESNLRFQMASLRKALGEDRDVIKTIPGRGYLIATDEPLAEAVKPGSPADAHVHPCLGIAKACDPQKIPLVVVIDDDEATREALHGLLTAVGWRVETFASVQSFVGRSSPSLPDCLVLDVWMPGRSGLDFQSELVSMGQAVPVIFISGQADIPMSVRAMKAGAIEFLTKPVHHEELLAAISTAVAASLQIDE
jgi:DNA-binding response OmpR family regulator